MSHNIAMRRSMLAELLEGEPATKKQRTASKAPISTLMMDGQRALQEKRYKAAIRHFTSAIENLQDRKADLVHVYDLRSNTHIKLSQLDEALKDAKKMIRADRADSRGYLQGARVEQLKDNLTGAIRVCELGMKSVSRSDKGYARLEAQFIRTRELTKKKVVFEKGTDPMTVLPTELLDLVLNTLTYKQAVGILRVCKTWRTRLRETDTVSRTIDTRESSRLLSYEQLKAAFSRLENHPKLLALANLSDTAARLASSELKRWIRWESLESLVLDEGKLQVSRIRFDKLKNLQNLQTGPRFSFTQDAGDILKSCTSLRTMALYEIRVVSLFIGDAHSPGLTTTPLMNHSLRRLAISSPKSFACHLALSKHCPFPSLECLELGHITTRGDLDLTAYTNLKELTLHNVAIDDDLNHYILRTPLSLQKFTLTGIFPDVYPRPEEIKMPASNMITINVRGSSSLRYIAYAIRQGLSRDNFRNLSISDFVTYSNVAGRLISTDLNLLRSIQGTQALANVEVLALKDENLIQADLATITTLFPAIRHLEIESPLITEAFVSELVRHPRTRVESVTLRNCINIPMDIVKWGRSQNVDIKYVRQIDQETVFGGRRVQHE